MGFKARAVCAGLFLSTVAFGVGPKSLGAQGRMSVRCRRRGCKDRTAVENAEVVLFPGLSTTGDARCHAALVEVAIARYAV